ncbi:methionine adenosyltransferase [Holdemania filiformis]|uniref:methionine adenosyltransferase n=1 Tax=Holdemania filiformis TaxID=61171 RepID=UPI002670092D|nr:methionine adenosyltransferase [Holdemania filiformis]
MKKFFTSESVTSGHPDKICDAISDAILDEALRQDPASKMAVETTIKDNLIFIYGEANTNADLPFEKIAKDKIREIGYTEEFEVLTKVSKQSAEIYEAVMHDEADMGAGDQGIMFGYACNETENYMPMPIALAHRLAERLEQVRKQEAHSILKPDGKTQVTVEYDDNKPVRLDTIVVSTQHIAEATQEEIRAKIINEVINPVIDANLIDKDTKILVNPSGSFVVGGPFGDSGTTGRKIVVDTYGGMGRIGGGCFSSKDPSKVDRSAAYYSRFVAKNLVAAGLADRLEIEVSYAIGKSEPISIYVETFGTGKVSDEEILEIIHKNFDFRVSSILRQLELKKPIYSRYSAYGHFGRSDCAWEKLIELKR